ncbi:hypothetical protein ES703_87261 [subsurface metagenome]
MAIEPTLLSGSRPVSEVYVLKFSPSKRVTPLSVPNHTTPSVPNAIEKTLLLFSPSSLVYVVQISPLYRDTPPGV